MAANPDIYGVDQLEIDRTFGTMYAANFTSSTPTYDHARLQEGIDNSKYIAGSLLDSSICTHGIPAASSGDHIYNTLFDIGAFNAMGKNDNCVLQKYYTGQTVPIYYRANIRSRGLVEGVYGNLRAANRFNAPGKNGTMDLYRLCPITKIDFKKFIFSVVVAACEDFTPTDNGDGTYTVSSTPAYKYFDLAAYTSDTIYSSSKTPMQLYPHICQVLLIPQFQRSGSSPVWTNFSFFSDAAGRIGCTTNMMYDYTCSGYDTDTSRCTVDNTGGIELNRAADYMEQPASNNPVTYISTGNTYNTVDVGTVSSTAIMILLGMAGGNGTSTGIDVQSYVDDADTRYIVHTCRGYTHMRAVYTNTASDRRNIFAYWVDQPQTKTALLDAVHKMCSYTGAVFTDTLDGAGHNINDIRYIGRINSSGVATGTYTQLTDDDFDNFLQTASDNFIDDTPYVPGSGYDPNTYSDTTELHTRPFKTSNLFNSVYAVNYDIYMLDNYLYDIVAPTATADTNLQKFLNANPVDCIVNLMYFQLDFTQIFHGGYHQVKLGNQPITFTIGQTTYVFEGLQPDASDSMQVILDMGSVNYYPHFGDFRDYEPYSSAELIIPYHGAVSISPAEYMGHDIGVKAIVDLATGASIAYIFRDGLAVDSISGTVGVQIPVSGIAQADYNNSVFNASAQLNAAKISAAAGFASDTIGLVASAVSANPLGVAASVTKIAADTAAASNNLDIAQYNVSHVKIPYRQSGTSTPATSTAADQYARLIVRRPKMLEYDPQIYAEVNGYACLLCDTLSGYTGFTVCSDVHIGGGATAEEKNMIRSLLQAGIYL